jgi:hypothetical protein
MGALRDIEYYLMNNNPNVYAYEWAWSSALNNDGNPIPNWNRKYKHILIEKLIFYPFQKESKKVRPIVCFHKSFHTKISNPSL